MVVLPGDGAVVKAAWRPVTADRPGRGGRQAAGGRSRRAGRRNRHRARRPGSLGWRPPAWLVLSPSARRLAPVDNTIATACESVVVIRRPSWSRICKRALVRSRADRRHAEGGIDAGSASALSTSSPRVAVAAPGVGRRHGQAAPGQHPLARTIARRVVLEPVGRAGGVGLGARTRQNGRGMMANPVSACWMSRRRSRVACGRAPPAGSSPEPAGCRRAGRGSPAPWRVRPG